MRTLGSILVLLLLPISVIAWGQKGHLMINELAIDAAAPRLPEFMNVSRAHLIYNAYEPDRWRDEETTPMHTAQAPDHFFDSEYWGPISTIEADRYAFMEKAAAKKIELVKIGYVPYAIIENYGRLVNAFRFWRNAKTPSDRESARANAVYIAGLMGHYVGDSAQPLHNTIHYNGWADNMPNPRNFTNDRRFHSRYETAYVNSAISIGIVKAKMQPPQRLKDVWASIKQHLTQAFSELNLVYEMEKAGEFNPQQPRPKGTDVIATQMARGATMLASLWYTAWLESGEPIPKKPEK